MKLFMKKKEARRTWAEHFLYMGVVSYASNGADSLVLTKSCITRRQS